jgi:hypothetical protein
MKNGINTGQFRVKTESCGNGRKNPSPISVNTETGPRKYGNEQTKVENGTGQNMNLSVRFQRYVGTVAPTGTASAYVSFLRLLMLQHEVLLQQYV